MKYFILIGSIMLTAPVCAADINVSPGQIAERPCPKKLGSDLTFPKGKAFEITEYIPETNTYRVLSVRLPDESEMFVTLEALALAVSQIRSNQEVIARNPEEILGEQYVGKKDLRVLTDKEVEERRGCRR